ncbi:hypothetical protein GCM10027082_41470 [Comamonas humi]
MPFLPTFAMLGSGPAVLLLHDADSDHLGFAPQVELLASQGWRAIAWDMPGYRGSPPPPSGYSLPALAATAAHLLETLKIPHAHVVGHGVGAMVALELALRHPALVRRLVLVAGGPALDAEAHGHWVDSRLELLAQYDGGAAAGEPPLARFAEQVVLRQTGRKAVPAGQALARHALAQLQPLAYRRMLQMLAEYQEPVERYRQLAQPALLIGGGQDVCMPPALLQTLANTLPDAVHMSLPEIGHWPQMENPEDFEGLLLSFLAARDQPALH